MTSGELSARKVVRTALLLRLVAAVAIYVFMPWGALAPDEDTYHQRGGFLAQYWRSEIPVSPLSGTSEPAGYYYIVAALYYPFGPVPLLPKLLNAWLGSLVVLEFFRLTRLISGNENAALRATKFVAFFPSMILWSSLMVRDVWVQWLLARLAREMAELKGRFIPTKIVYAGGLIWGLTQFRSYLLYAAVGPLILSFVLSRSKDVLRNLVLGSIFLLGLSYVETQNSAAGKVTNLDLAEVQRLRSWSSSEAAANSGFGRDADVSTVGGALSFLPTGLTYFFFAPFPWQATSLSKAMAVPETIYFYTLVPGILSGIAYLFRQRLADAVGVLLMTMTVTFGYAIGQGNVGTLYRHKAQVIGFYYAFAAVGIESRKRRQTAPARYSPYAPSRMPARASGAAANWAARRDA